MAPFIIFGRQDCGYCRRAKQLCEIRELPFRYVDIIEEGISKEDLEVHVGKEVKTVPQIFHGKTHIGGFTELNAYLAEMQSQMPA